METKVFIENENMILRQQLDEANNKISIYESILFDSLKMVMHFDVVPDTTTNQDPTMIVRVSIPNIDISNQIPLSKIRHLILDVLREK